VHFLYITHDTTQFVSGSVFACLNFYSTCSLLEIVGFRHVAILFFAVLGCCAALVSSWLSTFRDKVSATFQENLVVPSVTNRQTNKPINNGANETFQRQIKLKPKHAYGSVTYSRDVRSLSHVM